MTGLPQQLLRILENAPAPRSVADLAFQVERDRHAVGKACGVLHRRGLVDRVSLGVYRLSTAGHALLDAGGQVGLGPSHGRAPRVLTRTVPPPAPEPPLREAHPLWPRNEDDIDLPLPATALPETLPPALADLATALGVEGLVRLLRCYGGIRIYLPRTLTAAHPLARALGLETARALCQHLGPSRYDVDVPTGRDLFRQMRDQDIRAAHAQGDSIRTLARRFRLSERRVRRVLASTHRLPTLRTKSPTALRKQDYLAASLTLSSDRVPPATPHRYSGADSPRSATDEQDALCRCP